MDNLQIWKDRCDSLTGRLHVLANSSELNGIPREQTIVTLLNNLRDFGSEHFHFFFNDFKKKAGAKLLDANNKFPKAAVLHWIISQISYDMDVIIRAWDQRRPKSIYREKLNIADKLGHIALQPAKDCNFIPEDTTVLAYFQKSYSVRLIPYAKVALVGIPITALSVPQDYLAIPHEVAHYVFRHGTKPTNGTFDSKNESISHFLKKKIKSLLPDRHNYLQNWIEEMFADMYGCIIAGPVIALDFQDLQLDDPLSEFADAEKDKEDPTPLVRPDTYTKVLGILPKNKSEWKNLSSVLHKRWVSYRDEYWKNFNANHSDIFSKPIKLDDNNPSIRINQSAKREANEFRHEGVELRTVKAFDKIINIIWTDVLGKLPPIIESNEANNIPSYLFHWSGDPADLRTIFPNRTNVKGAARQELDDELIKLYKNFSASIDTFNLQSIVLTDAKPFQNESVGSTNGLKNIWEDWFERFEKQSLLKHWDRKTEKKAEKEGEQEHGNRENENVSKREYGWYELAYADGWVTRGPEPNPVGD